MDGGPQHHRYARLFLPSSSSLAQWTIAYYAEVFSWIIMGSRVLYRENGGGGGGAFSYL